MSHIAVVSIAAILVSASAVGLAGDQPDPFQAARELEQGDKLQEAFLGYVAIPGAQHLAVRIAGSQPQEYLALLRNQTQAAPAPLVKAVEGDLQWALGDQAAALACYRTVAKLTATAEEQTWATGHVPRDAYLAEPPATRESFPFDDWPIEPFAAGPGSHRDNWLIRRFITLDAPEDAAREFARVWEIHRRRSEPYRVRIPVRMDGAAVVTEERLVRPAGFDSRGLQFALDYTFFLKRIGKGERALPLLQEALLRIDMDRNPNALAYLPLSPQDLAAKYPLQAAPAPRFPWGTAGASRKEFVRLVYGLFKDAGQEQPLVEALQKRIDGGENRLRRVLARVRFHQAQVDEALTLELDYLKFAEFNALTVAYRRGLVYEEVGRPGEAVAALEQALELPCLPLQLPDPDEAAVEASMMRQADPLHVAADSPAGQLQFRAGIVARLERLYGALGQPNKALELSLQNFESHPELLANLDALEQTRRRSEALGREAAFLEWVRRRLPAAKTSGARANLHWLLEDYAACAQALAESWKQAERQVGNFEFEPWLDRFRKVGKEQARLLLTAAVEADPKNARLRLELLDLSERFAGPEVIAAFESLLETDATFAFARGKGVYNRTRFRNYFELAYRLLRLYEQAQDKPKLLALGLRIATGEKPFGEWWKDDWSQHQYRDDNDLPEDVNACLALIVQHADDATLEKLAKLWKERPACAAQRQLARRRSHRLAGDGELPDIGWQHLPAGVRLIVSSENVLSLARDERYLYAGFPWGLEVYLPDGKPVTRIALGEPVEALAADPLAGQLPADNAGAPSPAADRVRTSSAAGTIWAGTPRGLFRIQRDGWAVSHLWLHGDVPPQNRYERSFPGSASYGFDNQVSTLVLDGEDLWIGLQRNIQRLNTRTLTLRAFSYQELQSENWIGANQLVPDGEYVWAGQRDLTLRYDRATDRWERVGHGKRNVGLIGLIGGQVYVNAWLDDKLRNRPCLLDRRTLQVTPLLIDAGPQDRDVLVNEPFSFLGRYHGQIVLGANGPGYVVDEAQRRIRPLPKSWQRLTDPLNSILPDGFRSGPLRWSRTDGGEMQAGSSAPDTIVRSDYDQGFTVLASPAGLRVAGRRYSAEADPTATMPHEKHATSGGLHFFPPAGAASQVSLVPAADRLGGDVVFAIVDDPVDHRKWLCTDYGLAVLDRDDRVVARLTRDDGLAANRVTSGAAAHGRLYFGGGWADHGGGLLVFDPQTLVLTARFSSDGLATNKLAAVTATDDRLRLTYGVEYGRGGDYRYRQFPPGTFDPRSGEVQPGGEPSFFDDSGLEQRRKASRAEPRPLPYLGGEVLTERRIDGKTYLGGTRGLVILAAEAPEKKVSELTATVIVDPEVRLKEQAKAAQLQIRTPSDLQEALKSANPFYRARALAVAWHAVEKEPPGYLPVLAAGLRDPHRRPRSTAMVVVSHIKDQAVIPLLREALSDRDGAIRAAAALSLARLGQLPPLAQVEEIFDNDYGNFPFDADSSIGVQASKQDAYEALAPLADRDIFRLFLEHPPTLGNHENRTKVFPALGASLRRHPEAAQLLLRAYDEEPYSNSRREFAQTVFHFSGAELLPVLHEALPSQNRIVRSNAARGCGAIGDRSSIPPLIQALDLESGLSRASIVWALGELKARESLPQLATLYADARNDEKRQRGAGFRMAQAAAQAESHFEALQDQRAISAEWDEMQRTSRRQPRDPRRNEPLLETRTILEAVAKIGPESSQEFYRALAAESDAEARMEAAARLAEGSPADRPRNLPVLRNLLADSVEQVRISAAGSLLILGETDVRKPLLAWLGAPEPWLRNQILLQFERVPDGQLLAFARRSLEQFPPDHREDPHQLQRVRQLLQRIPEPDP